MSEPPVDREPSYQVRAEPRSGYLRVEISGVRSTLAASIAGWREVARLVRQHHPQRLLVVSRLSGPMPTPEEQHAAIRALSDEPLRGLRFALVLEDSRNVGKLEHSEMLLREMGEEARVFGSEALAEVWLRHGDSGPPPTRRR